MKPNKILFICKKRKSYGSGEYTQTVSSGLLNSATFVNDMLIKNGIDSHIVEVIDNNCIDREVTKYKPTHVIIEALWVVPSKFEVLTALHPKVKWIIRLHSEIPFLANEGIAMKWLFDYQVYDKVIISVNSLRIEKELNALLPKKTLYLPNFYPVQFSNLTTPDNNTNRNVINIACFGAVRPLKNHLIQAVAAIEFADLMKKHLKFHINTARIENNGDPVLKNIRNLFINSNHELIEHTWLTHEDFLELIKTMDLCMQVSFSETFNIVAADAVNENVPVVVSPEIKWVAPFFKVSPTSSDSIVKKLKFTWWTKFFNLHFVNKVLLYFNSIKAECVWLENFDNAFSCYECYCQTCQCQDICNCTDDCTCNNDNNN